MFFVIFLQNEAFNKKNLSNYFIFLSSIDGDMIIHNCSLYTVRDCGDLSLSTSFINSL